MKEHIKKVGKYILELFKLYFIYVGFVTVIVAFILGIKYDISLAIELVKMATFNFVKLYLMIVAIMFFPLLLFKCIDKIINKVKRIGDKNVINEFRGKYYFLSNFYNAPVTYEGITYLNNESAFQSAKTCEYDKRLKFANLDSSSAKRKGRNIKLKHGWDIIKFDIMYEICLAKFTQNQDLREKLLATGGEHLEEGNTWGDKIWGTVNGIGQNNLGKILMRVREELK